ncbi:MAG: UPF0175 family protein [Calditrichota bacterium]
MKTITLQIPDDVEISDLDAKMLFATRLYENGKASLGQAAEIVGLSKSAFVEILHLYDVSPFNYSPEELKRDMENAESHHS